MEDRAPGAAAEGSVWIGAYSLEVAGSGSFARFDAEEEREHARALGAALDEAADEPPAAVAAIEEFQESADAVTSRIEEADKLLRTAAAGDLLKVRNLSGEIDSLLDLFTRLDKAGRFEEELKLMRSLNGLLALTFRWVDLIRSLLALLRSAKAAGHAAGQAFAHHELGSLKLCAGRPKEAARDLDEALRLEEAIGDVAGRCATRHNLDSARRDTLRGGRFGRPRGIQRLVILGGAIAIAAGGAGIGALANRGGGNTTGGGGGGGGSQATLIVHKRFGPNAPHVSVAISVTCTNGGRPDSSPKSASATEPAKFTIAGFVDGATCTASEDGAPAGYTAVERGCRDVPIVAGARRSCTITNRRQAGPAILTVSKVFAPNASTIAVEVSVACTEGGSPDRSPKRVTQGTPAKFTITGVGNGVNCTAMESPTPSGYIQDNRGCRKVALGRGSSKACTIFNTRSSLPPATLKVFKDFSDGSSTEVSISVGCDSGVVTKTPIGATEGSPATFTITGFRKGATCIATEGNPPAGYTADESSCHRVVITSGIVSSCKIVNTLNTTTLTVRKDYTDSNTSGVLVELSCSSGNITDTRLTASPSSPAVFTISGFDTGATCDAIEVHFSGKYDRDESDCTGVPLVSKGECTIVNSPTG